MGGRGVGGSFAAPPIWGLGHKQLLPLCPSSPLLLQNWGPVDGPPPLPGGWSDAWTHLHPGEAGLTYDPKSNPMLRQYKTPLRRRLDRVFVRLRHWRLHAMEMLGQDALPGGGLRFEGRPVLPSDHFGLLLELRAA